ncbi:squalene/phytoene synthase family protein [Actibacterium sp.]|uniref:squalene/phytoene synthase family protein n=1 Tax=Actibacterium sp. TaxID=1872125 RepID=UPI0035670493
MTVQACADLVQRGDPDRFLAVMAAAPAARAVLFPIYAFNLEVARAPWVASEPMIAEMRLQWWRDALDEIAQGGVVRRHEVVTPLAEVLDGAGAAVLDDLIAARRWECYRDPFQDQADFDRYIDATAGHLMWVAARALGAGGGEAAIRDYAYASGVANWLRAVPALEARGRIPLLDGRPEGVAALATGALVRLKAARRAKRSVPAAARPALLAGWQAEAVLKLAATDPAAVIDERLVQSDFARKGGLLGQALTGRW